VVRLLDAARSLGEEEAVGEKDERTVQFGKLLEDSPPAEIDEAER
jgi:hypothetical protein